MLTPLPEEKEALFAYLCIRDFFDMYSMADALLYVQNIINTANTNKLWKQTPPYRLLIFMQQLNKLNSAVFAIHHNHFHRDDAVIVEDFETTCEVAALLLAATGNKRAGNLWACFPRNLSLKQLCNPYKAIEKYCQYLTEAEWKNAFAGLQEFALAPLSIQELEPPYHILKLQKLLCRLIEACHLLHVRTNLVRKG